MDTGAWGAAFLSGAARSRARVLLALILVVGAALRFVGLSAGLRHVPHEDERYFVENVGWMLAHGDLDHRFHEYPGLVFLLLAPVLAFFDPPEMGASAYLAARAVVALFSLASVGLVYALATKLAGRSAGLLAAALLAVSPIDVDVAHAVRPDAVLGCVALLVLLALARPERPHYDLLAGLAIGAAVAVKFSGILLVPAYLVARAARPGFGMRALASASCGALLAFGLFSPGSLMRFPQLVDGVWVQLVYHYGERGRGDESFLALFATYLLRLLRAFALPGIALIAAGAALACRDWRRFGPSLAFVAATLVVFSTAEIQRQRFLAPITGALALLAGVAVQSLGRRHALFPLAALAALPLPLLASLEYVRRASTPSPRDRALDWIEAWMPEGARILTTLPELGIDRTRFEVMTLASLDERARRKALHWDLLVTSGAAAPRELEGWDLRYVARPARPSSGEPIALIAPRPEQRPLYEPIAPDAFQLRASENEHLLPELLNPRLGTFWTSHAPQDGSAWLQVDFKQPTRLGRVELLLGHRPRHYAAGLDLFVSENGIGWKRVSALRGRPPAPTQLKKFGISQLRVLEGEPILGLRIQQRGFRARPWQVALLRLDAVKAASESASETSLSAGQP